MSEFRPATELFEEVTYEQVMEPVTDRIGEVREQWVDVGKQEVISRMPDLTTQASYNRAQSIAIVNPTDQDGKPTEIDESSTVILAMPYANGWTPHHFIRAKIMQEVVAPNSRVIAIPNNGWGQQNYQAGAMDKFYGVDIMTSLAGLTANTLRVIDGYMSLGKLSITGYSQGGNMSIKLANSARGHFDIDKINIDEPVSKIGRRTLGIMTDFALSGGDYAGAIKQADLQGLSEVMPASALAMDVLRSPAVQLKKENRKLLSDGMRGSIEPDLVDLLGGYPDIRTNIKIGRIAGSRIFDPESISFQSAVSCGKKNLRHYVGDEFKGHASGDNVFLHAAMVNDGFKTHC